MGDAAREAGDLRYLAALASHDLLPKERSEVRHSRGTDTRAAFCRHREKVGRWRRFRARARIWRARRPSSCQSARRARKQRERMAFAAPNGSRPSRNLVGYGYRRRPGSKLRSTPARRQSEPSPATEPPIFPTGSRARTGSRGWKLRREERGSLDCTFDPARQITRTRLRGGLASKTPRPSTAARKPTPSANRVFPI